MTTAKKPKSIVLCLALCVLSLSGCATKLGYHWLDWWLQSKLENYVDLNPVQASYTEAALDRFHQWHRYQALPEYSQFLQEIEARLTQQQPITTQQTHQWLGQIVIFWDQSMMQFVTPGAELLRQLSEQQLNDAMRAAAEEEQDLLKDKQAKTPEQQLQQRQKQITKQLKPWIGKPSLEQKELIDHWAQNRQDNQQLEQQENNKWRQALAALQRNKQDLTATEQGLADLLTRPEDLWSDTYQQSIQYNQQLTVEFITNLLNSLTEKQRQRFIDKLQSYQKIFNSLSVKSGTA